MRLSEAFIEKVKSSIPIEDVIGEYVTLKKRGSNYIGLCPFHSEKTPSFTVSPTKNIFHCFGCGIGGNVFTFLQKINNISFIESVKLLAEKANIPFPKQNSSYTKEDLEKENIYKVNEKAAYIYNYYLTYKQNKAIEYLRKRHITDETIKKFYLGYAPEKWDNLYKNLKESKYSDEIMLKAGLVKKSKIGSYFDIFRNRLIIPIFDINNHVTGFGGRIIEEVKDSPKYLNTPETPVFHKGSLLFGLNIAKNFIREKDEIIIVEGYFDVIMAYQNNIKNVVAPLGTALTENHIKILSRYSKNILLIFDPDSAGEKATWRSIELLLKQNFRIKILRLPFQLDPYDYIDKHGRENFLKLKNEAPDVFTYMISILREKYDIKTVFGKLKLLSYVFKYLILITNKVEQEIIFSLLARELNVSKESIIIEFNKYKKDRINFLKPTNISNKTVVKTKLDFIKKIEQKFIVLILLNKKERENIFNLFTPDDFTDEVSASLFSLMSKLLQTKPDFNTDDILNMLNPEKASIITEILLSDEFKNIENIKTGSEVLENLLRDYTNKLLSNKLDKIIKKIKDEINKLDPQKDLEKISVLQKDLALSISERNKLKLNI